MRNRHHAYLPFKYSVTEVGGRKIALEVRPCMRDYRMINYALIDSTRVVKFHNTRTGAYLHIWEGEEV